jgi:hypothetical protein
MNLLHFPLAGAMLTRLDPLFPRWTDWRREVH